MAVSPDKQIESIVSDLERRGPAAAPIEAAMELAANHPEAIRDLAVAVMGRFPKGGTFLDGALSYLPEKHWPPLIKQALDFIEESSVENEAATSVIEYASLQATAALNSHLSRIFALRPNVGTLYEFTPWRAAENTNVNFLKDVIESESSGDEDRKRAWRAMIETRNPAAIEYALFESGDLKTANEGWSEQDWIKAHLDLAGLQLQGRTLHRLCPDALFHIHFPLSFFEGQSRPPWLARIHPTWKLPSDDRSLEFGGMTDSDCSLCGEKVHRLLCLDSIPEGLGISGMPRVELAVCLSCLGWERQPLFYRHAEHGRAVNIGYTGPKIEPQFPVGPLRNSKIHLAPTPRRWHFQEWGSSNSRENLNRVGGEPSWVQSPEYPECPSCLSVMHYLVQLDSDLAMDDGGEWLWGSGGIAYGFWCDSCKVSAFLWQCT